MAGGAQAGAASLPAELPQARGRAGAGPSGQGRPGQSLALVLPHAPVSLGPPWRSIPRGAPALLGSSIGLPPCKVGPPSSGAVGFGGHASPPYSALC